MIHPQWMIGAVMRNAFHHIRVMCSDTADMSMKAGTDIAGVVAG